MKLSTPIFSSNNHINPRMRKLQVRRLKFVLKRKIEKKRERFKAEHPSVTITKRALGQPIYQYRRIAFDFQIIMMRKLRPLLPA
jgi:hypothetical protein